MKRYACIVGNVAHLVVKSEDRPTLEGDWVECGDASAGDLYDAATGAFSRPAAVPDMPLFVSMRQAKRALLAAGLLDLADQAIAGIADESARRAAQIDWTSATEVRRDWPLVAAIAQALHMTEAQIDALFIEAASL